MKMERIVGGGNVWWDDLVHKAHMSLQAFVTMSPLPAIEEKRRPGKFGTTRTT